MANKYMPRQFNPKLHKKQQSQLLLEELKHYNQAILILAATVLLIVGFFVTSAMDYEIAMTAAKWAGQ